MTVEIETNDNPKKKRSVLMIILFAAMSLLLINAGYLALYNFNLLPEKLKLESFFTEKKVNEVIVTVQKNLHLRKDVQKIPSGVASTVPSEFQVYDTDKNGVISSAEIKDATEKSLDDKSDITPDDVKKLLDYFYEQ